MQIGLYLKMPKDTNAIAAPAVDTSLVIQRSNAKPLRPIPWRARVYVFLTSLPVTFKYNSLQVAEQSGLFFGIGVMLGIVLQGFPGTLRIQTLNETLSTGIIVGASLFMLVLLWIVQERFAINGYHMQDPLTVRVHWRRLSRQFRGFGSSKKLLTVSGIEHDTSATPPKIDGINAEAVPCSTPLVVAKDGDTVLRDDDDEDSEEEEETVKKEADSQAKVKYELPKPRQFTSIQENAIALLVQRYFDRSHLDQWKKSQFLCVNEDGRAAAIRALDARRWKTDPASVLIENNIKWREKEGIDDVFSKVVPDRDVRAIRVAMGDGFFGQDRTGMPIYWCPAGLVNIGSLHKEVPLENMVTLHVQTIEYNQRVWYRELSQKQGRCIYQATCVLDLQGFSTKNTSGSFFECMNAITSIDKDFYYENLYKVYILHAPVFFRFFWNSVSQLLQPETRAKFIFLAHSKELHNFIDPDFIPTRFGGNYTADDALFSENTIETSHSKAFDKFLKEWRRSTEKS